MPTETTDADVLTFALAGCNAAEIAAYARISEAAAAARIARVLRDYAHPPRAILALRQAA